MINRVAIITGASQGIGKSIAMHFVKNSYKVVAADINSQPKDKWWEKEAFSNNIIFIKTDVSDEESVKNMINITTETFGDNIKVLVNNAAISNPYQFNKNLENLSLDEWNKYMSVNLTSVFLTCKYSIPFMKKIKSSSIINISSTRALMSEPNSEAYAATKGGVNSMTHALAISLGKDGIRVNCVVPGWINTINYIPTKADEEQHPTGKVGKVEDISEIVLFLADEEKSGFITGQTFVVDGGMTKKMIYQE